MLGDQSIRMLQDTFFDWAQESGVTGRLPQRLFSRYRRLLSSLISSMGVLMRRIENKNITQLFRDEIEMLLLNLASFQKFILAKR